MTFIAKDSYDKQELLSCSEGELFGDSNGKLSRLRDKRVAIIGTGATAIQCVPHLGESAKELFVFQK